MPREFEALLGKAVDIRSFELFLAVARQITVTEIICKYIDDVRLGVRLEERGARQQACEKNFERGHKF